MGEEVSDVEELKRLVAAMNLELSARTAATEAMLSGLFAEAERKSPGLAAAALKAYEARSPYSDDPVLNEAVLATFRRVLSTVPSGDVLAAAISSLRKAFGRLRQSGRNPPRSDGG